jgi:hypothetical protein
MTLTGVEPSTTRNSPSDSSELAREAAVALPARVAAAALLRTSSRDSETSLPPEVLGESSDLESSSE